MTWGVGGVARIGQGELPAETVIGEHVRLGSQWIILSRAFHSGAATSAELLETLDFRQKLTNCAKPSRIGVALMKPRYWLTSGNSLNVLIVWVVGWGLMPSLSDPIRRVLYLQKPEVITQQKRW
ncbi:hypothetical protein HSBAA_63700 [Vreelandella sulfidaeris]|uniref:Uncharacterized protein n=1 Tax=Vreelandella sulfidaeris TaxID=115553 RepID=A0A455UQ59_9GAMM|nr:hypothetical protein HSBAA_63700 [Halomonas sulfidaeris]